MNIPELVKILVLIFQRPRLLIQTSISRSESGGIIAGCNCRDVCFSNYSTWCTLIQAGERIDDECFLVFQHPGEVS